MVSSKDSTVRFTDRVENYVKYRPGYPAEVIAFFERRCGITNGSVIADIGSGTGISAKIFLEHGCVVYGVEPNDAMRSAAEEFLQGYENFHSINATAEATSLKDGSVDLVIAAQAFHWFDPDRTRAEFKRILKPGGYTALIWNERQTGSSDFLKEYEELHLKYGRDYKEVRHDRINDGVLRDFFQQDFERTAFQNHQTLDLNGLKGRVFSSSYMPNSGDETYPAVEKEIERHFAKYAEQGKIKVFYDTNIYICQL